MNTLEIKLEVIDGYFETFVFIDGEKIDHYADVFDFFCDVVSSGKNINIWSNDTHGVWQQNQWSNFYPFTCSCGNAGCAHIDNGIMSKHRKHTVEWRAKKQDGYHFIKSFYKFYKKQYINAIKDAWQQLQELFDKQTVIQYHGSERLLKEYFEDYFLWNEVKSAPVFNKETNK